MKTMMRCAAVAAALLAATSAGAQQPAQPSVPAPPADWSAAARQDVLAAYDLYVANHPGMHDPGNPGFPAQLARARDAALAAADHARDRNGYADALGAFSAELSDGHAQLLVKNQPGAATAQREWPGFVAAWRGDRVVVHSAAAGAPAPAGATIVSCNGRPAADFVRGRLRTRGFRHAEAGAWWFWTPRAFQTSATLSTGRPERCTFRTGDSEREAAMTWSPVPDNYDALLAAATDGERTPIGLSQPRQGMFLLGMPDFGPNPEGVAAYRQMYDVMRQRRSDLLDARAVVIDLRHNNGGSSYWSQEAAEILWGEAEVTRRMNERNRDVAILWRASEGNTAYIADLVRQLRGSGNNELADDIEAVGEGMRGALARGEPFFREADEEDDAPSETQPQAPFERPVYVIIPGRCGSACLDALDVFTRFPNTRLIGAPTQADSLYMEVRVVDLPSGQGRVVIPNKMWAGRPRRSGEVYQPHILVTDRDWSTAAFLDRIEQDLTRR